MSEEWSGHYRADLLDDFIDELGMDATTPMRGIECVRLVAYLLSVVAIWAVVKMFVGDEFVQFILDIALYLIVVVCTVYICVQYILRNVNGRQMVVYETEDSEIAIRELPSFIPEEAKDGVWMLFRSGGWTTMNEIHGPAAEVWEIVYCWNGRHIAFRRKGEQEVRYSEVDRAFRIIKHIR